MEVKTQSMILGGTIGAAGSTQVAPALARVTIHHIWNGSLPTDVATDWNTVLAWVYGGLIALAIGAVTRLMTKKEVK